MNHFRNQSTSQLAALFFLLTLLVSPLPTLARVNCSSNYTDGASGESSPEGDPLDSNDAGSGGGGQIDIQERGSAFDSGSNLFGADRLLGAKILLLQIDVLNGVPVFSLRVVSILEVQVEANHVR